MNITLLPDQLQLCIDLLGQMVLVLKIQVFLTAVLLGATFAKR